MVLNLSSLKLFFYQYWTKKILSWKLSWKSRKKILKKTKSVLFFKKLLSRSRYEIEGKSKLFIDFIWNWNSIIPKIILTKSPLPIEIFIWKNVKIVLKKESYKSLFQEDV